jgi:hypothetical protein
MKKILLPAILAIATFLGLSAQVQQKALVEEFTGAWCGYCPDGALILEDIITTNPNAIGVSIHNSDAMVTSTGNIVEGFFNNLGFPSGIVNRNDESMSRSLWESATSSATAGMSDVGVSFESWSYNATTRTVTVTVKVDAFATKVGTHRLGLILTEDDVTGSGSGYDQVNYYNTTAGHPYYGAGNPIVGFSHDHVARAFVGGAWGGSGVVADSLYNGYSTSYTFTTILSPSWDETKMKMVAWVGNYDGSGLTQRSIINSEEIDMNVITGVNNPVGASSFALTAAPNPFKDITTAYYTLDKTSKVTIDVVNVMGQHVATLYEGLMTSGTHSQNWVATGAAPGLYFIRITSESGESKSVKVMLAE